MQGDGGFRFDTEESLGDYVHKQQTVNSDGEFVDVEDEGSADDDTEEFYGEDSDNEQRRECHSCQKQLVMKLISQ